MLKSFSIQARLVNLFTNEINPSEIKIENGTIISVVPIPDATNLPFALPGFIDSHVHIESSMLIPSEFARLAVCHGTVATVSDPHEIANVLGIEGIKYMINNGKKVPFYFCFGVPSCVPATAFETSGATINADDVELLLQTDGLYYLSEMMNFPGVWKKDPEVMKKIAAAKKLGKPIDGHLPGIKGDEAKHYFDAGISTDHECLTYEEGLFKANLGVKILMREGSAAKNLDALLPLFETHPAQLMFCCDDKHPDSLEMGHINQLVIRAIAKGYNLFDVLRSACLLPAQHYKIPAGMLQIGDSADFIVVKNLENFAVLQTFIKGLLVAENGKSLLESVIEETPNQFHSYAVAEKDIKIIANRATKIRVIEALNGQLITNKLILAATQKNGELINNKQEDILKFVCVNRYSKAKPAVAFIRNFGFTRGAIAGSIAHDSHNIVAVGADDSAIIKAINLIMKHNGGICVVDGEIEDVMPLPIAGLMTTDDGYLVSARYSKLDKMAKELGSKLTAPFMTLSFMALLVIPKLKLSDKGLFDGENFTFTSLVID